MITTFDPIQRDMDDFDPRWVPDCLRPRWRKVADFIEHELDDIAIYQQWRDDDIANGVTVESQATAPEGRFLNYWQKQGRRQFGKAVTLDFAQCVIACLGNDPDPQDMTDGERYPLAAALLGIPVPWAMHILQPVERDGSGGMDRGPFTHERAFGRYEFDTGCCLDFSPPAVARAFRHFDDGEPIHRCWWSA